MKASIKIDTSEFRATLKEYKEYTKRDLATILNTKGFYIARGAARETLRVSVSKIRSELRAGSSIEADAPLAAVIINARRGAANQKGLFGDELKKAVAAFIKARIKSRAFMAAGFIPAIKAFEPFAERKNRAPKADRAVKQFGSPKGSGTPARPDSWISRAVITNTAASKHDKGGAEGVAIAGLQIAFDDEIVSMRKHIEDKMQETANKYNAKH